MLELRGLGKDYSAIEALSDVSLTIGEGEFFSLLGPSGCGKTTLLRLLAGFEVPTCGEIRMNGERIDRLPANKRHFNLVFQRYALFPHLDVFENVAFGLRMKRVPESEIRLRVHEMLALVRLEGYERRKIATLSGGQQQRVALARALVNRPRVLLLDEPLSALDLKLRQQMQVELRAIQRRLGLTFIFVTHDQDEALTLSTRVAVLNAGRVEQVGTPRDIYERPATEFVARFIGTINRIEGRVDTWEKSQVRMARGQSVFSARAAEGSVPLLGGSPVALLVRPEKLRLRRAPSNGAANRVDVTVHEILYQGATISYLLQSRDGGMGLLTATRSSVPSTEAEEPGIFVPGERACLEWDPEDAHVLDPKGGQILG